MTFPEHRQFVAYIFMDEFELFTTFTFNNRSVEVFADFGVSIIDRN